MFYHILIILLILFSAVNYVTFSQEEEQINYFQMEPLDDSLFIKIQNELFIDPPDPKAEITVDLRDPANQTISIKSVLYPLLALKQETRSKIYIYPFKLNLEETINYGSIFTRVINNLNLKKILNPPTLFQISSMHGYINPYFQLLGGERFGAAIKKDFGISFGFGTPYSGPLETNSIEVNLHMLGFKLGVFSFADVFVDIKNSNNHNNLFVTEGIQVAYVIPLGNFFEVGYLYVLKKFTDSQKNKYTVNEGNIIFNPDSTIKYQPYLLQGSHVNWEMRYPVRVLGSTRGKFYVAQFINEWHVGYLGREHAIAGSVFDFRFDAMVSSPVRQPQYVCDIIVQRIFDYWGFSSIALGPSFILSDRKDGNFGFTSLFFNMRIKIGSSL